MANKQAIVMVLLLLVLISSGDVGMLKLAEAQKICEVPSGKFQGYCSSSANCASVCMSEGFPMGGACRGFIRRCLCFKNC